MPSSAAKIIAYILAATVMVATTWIVAHKIAQNDFEDRLSRGQARAEELVTFFEADTLKILTIADNFIRETRRVYRNDPTPDKFAGFYEDSVPHNEFVSRIVLISPDGRILTKTGENSIDAPVVEEAYFSELRNNSDDRVYVTLPDQGQLTGRLTVGLVRRIELKDGSFGGAVLAAINVDEFTDFFATINLGPNSTATLVGLDRIIRARSSYGKLGPGQNISNSRLWSELVVSSVGQFRQTSVVDGVARFYSYRQIPDYPLLVAIGLAEDDVIRGASVFSQPLYAVAALISAVIIVLIAMLCFAEFARRRLQAENAVRRAAEEDLEVANTDLAQFAYSASHDLKAPLSSIRGLLGFCVEDLVSGDHDEVKRNLDEAIGISARASGKVESLLRLAKAGKQNVPDEEFSIHAMVTDIWKDQSAYLDERCELDLHIDGCPKIVTEKATVQVVLENIVSNAIRYRDEDKPETLISISTSSEADQTTIVIGDNGVGIAERDQDKVFEMFKRVDDCAGDGLGLALVKKSVERLGATMEMKSELGKGTEFTLIFRNLKGGIA